MSAANFATDGGLLADIYARTVTPRPDCMIWANAADRGYGRISVDGKVLRVHRVVWEIVNGPIPDGLTVDHLCRVRTCVNTEHMELVTAEENTLRAVPFKPRASSKPGRRRASQTTCRNGHEWPAQPARNSLGHRICAICLEVRRASSAPASPALGLLNRFPLKPSTECRKGHALTPDNVTIWALGGGRYQRRCVTCSRAAEMARRSRRTTA